MEADCPDIFQHHQKKRFFFPDVPATAVLRLEKLNLQNFEFLFHLFETDTSDFVDERFKSYEAAKAYTEQLITYGAYSAKHGGQDWLFTWQGIYAGIMHLYDLSLETCNQNEKRAWIGIAVARRFRGKGIAAALGNFVQYIFQSYPVIHSFML